MLGQADKIPGISVDVADLVAVRGRLGGLLSRRRPGQRAGTRDLRLRGRGMEYEESRAYAPGDDMRTMDWQVMARTGEPHTKIFSEEKERRFLLAIDLSWSMFFGTRLAFKSHAAAMTAAHLGWLASLAGDRLGGLIASTNGHYEVRPGKHRSSLITLFHHLAEANRVNLPPVDQASHLNHLLHELKRVVKPGSIIALISDCISADERSRELLSAIVEHNDVCIYWIYDQIELEPWPPGQYQIVVRGRKKTLNLEAGGEDWLRSRQAAHRDQVKALAAQFKLPLVPLSCNREISAQLLQAAQNS